VAGARIALSTTGARRDLAGEEGEDDAVAT
jgi:hypothetical protein